MMDPETVVDVDDKLHHGEHTIATDAISSRHQDQDADDDQSQDNTLVEMPVEFEMDMDYSKQKIVKASDEQKAVMLEFFQENPEIITHSSTWDNERELWGTLTNKLNELDPKKTTDAWKGMWYRWQHSVNKRCEEKLKCIDLKMKKWLDIVKSDSSPGRRSRAKSRSKPKKRINDEHIDSILKRIEKEKCNLHLEIDETEINIMRFRTILRTLENENAERIRRMKKLNERKIYYNCKKRKIMEVEEDDIKKLEQQLLAIDQKLAEEEP